MPKWNLTHTGRPTLVTPGTLVKRMKYAVADVPKGRISGVAGVQLIREFPTLEGESDIRRGCRLDSARWENVNVEIYPRGRQWPILTASAVVQVPDWRRGGRYSGGQVVVSSDKSKRRTTPRSALYSCDIIASSTSIANARGFPCVWRCVCDACGTVVNSYLGHGVFVKPESSVG